MSRLRYFFLNINIINGLLAVAVATVAYFTVTPFTNPTVTSLPRVKETTALPGEKAAPPQNSSPADYAVISDQNLFHPERKAPPEKQPEKVIPKPDIFLYGTLITDGASYAFIEDKKAPHSTEGRGKRQVTLKKGDKLSGYVLSEIEANRIILVKGEEKVVVMLDDKQKRRAGEVPALMVHGPQATPSSVRAVTPSGPGIGAPASRPLSQPAALLPHPLVPSNPPAAPASAQAAPSPKPGIGGSGSWPPTRSSIEQTQQKLREGRLMRAGQLQGN